MRLLLQPPLSYVEGLRPFYFADMCVVAAYVQRTGAMRVSEILHLEGRDVHSEYSLILMGKRRATVRRRRSVLHPTSTLHVSPANR